MDGHAQSEIRDYANAMASIVKQVCPLAWEAFEDFRLGAMTFSRTESTVLGEAMHLMRTGGDWAKCLERERDAFPTKREYDEFITKIRHWFDY
jgi:thymidylate synthase (FAD)